MFSMNASLPYGPRMNTDIDYNIIIHLLFVVL